MSRSELHELYLRMVGHYSSNADAARAWRMAVERVYGPHNHRRASVVRRKAAKLAVYARRRREIGASTPPVGVRFDPDGPDARRPLHPLTEARLRRRRWADIYWLAPPVVFQRLRLTGDRVTYWEFRWARCYETSPSGSRRYIGRRRDWRVWDARFTPVGFCQRCGGASKAKSLGRVDTSTLGHNRHAIQLRQHWEQFRGDCLCVACSGEFQVAVAAGQLFTMINKLNREISHVDRRNRSVRQAPPTAGRHNRKIGHG